MLARISSLVGRLVAVALVAGIAAGLTAGLIGCGNPGADSGLCSSNSDCGGQACTRAEVCSPAPGALTVHWTVDGMQPSLGTPGSCTSLGDLRLELVFSGRATPLRFSPVPCAVGQMRIDNLPLETLENVRLSVLTAAVEAQATRVDVAAVGSGGEYAVTLALR